MGLDYSRNTLRILSDDGYEGVIAEIFFDGPTARVVHHERPGGMPNLNNEGYAESDCQEGAGFAWFFADGEKSAALRAVPISCSNDEGEPGTVDPEPTDSVDPTEPTEPEISSGDKDSNGQARSLVTTRMTRKMLERLSQTLPSLTTWERTPKSRVAN